VKSILYFLIAVLFLAGCARLDDNLFNPNEHKISEYKLDAYTGEVDFRLDAAYDIPASKVHLFTLDSKGVGEATATKIWAVYIGDTARIATDTVIMYCHGNKDHMDFYWPRAQLLANAGGKNRYGVLMIDYRGYGLSEGKPSEEGLYHDTDAALQWLKSKGLSGNRLVMYGFSMGSAPAVKLTAEPRSLTPTKIMLEAPFASAAVMVQDATALALPAAFVTDLKINNAELIKSVQQPLLWFHGEADDFLNVNTHGRLVANNHGGPWSEQYVIPGAGHSNLPLIMFFERYLYYIHNFIRAS
jgi:pimeloyl-ACP methyl ester carboxylesterase